jgi:hypothetical protein
MNPVTAPRRVHRPRRVRRAPNPTHTDHIDCFGGSLSVGYRTEHTATDVGAIVSCGAGHDVATVRSGSAQQRAAVSVQDAVIDLGHGDRRGQRR